MAKGPGTRNNQSDFFEIKRGNAILQESITRILLTTPGERINNPTFGSRLKQYLFDLDNILEESIKEEISLAITRFEPRVRINNIFIEKKNPNQPHKIGVIISLTNLLTLEEFDTTI